MSFILPLKKKGFDLIMATFQKLIIVNVSTGLKGIINQCQCAQKNSNMADPTFITALTQAPTLLSDMETRTSCISNMVSGDNCLGQGNEL